jgi:hypothetical protein
MGRRVMADCRPVSVQSAAALGAADGHDFGGRQVAAVIMTLRAKLLSPPEERETAIGAAMATWAAKQTEERAARRLELAVRGATVEALIAFETSWATACDLQLRRAATDLDSLTTGDTPPAKPNRAARRKAKAAERKDLQ